MSSKLFFAQNVNSGGEIITKRTPGWIRIRNTADKISNLTLTLELEDGTGGAEVIPLIEAPDNMLCADVRPIIDGKTCGVKQIMVTGSSISSAFLYCFDDLSNRSLMDVQVIQDWGLSLRLAKDANGLYVFNLDGIFLNQWPIAQFGVYFSSPTLSIIKNLSKYIWDSSRDYPLQVRVFSDLEGNDTTIKNMIVTNGVLFNLTSDLPYAVTGTIQEKSLVRRFGGLNSQYPAGTPYRDIDRSDFTWLFSLDQALDLKQNTQLYVGVELEFNGSNIYYDALIARCPELLGQ